MREVKFEDLNEGDQFVGIWSHKGEIWSETYVKSGNGVLPYVLYNDEGDIVDDFTDETSTDPNFCLTIKDFKAYVF